MTASKHYKTLFFIAIAAVAQISFAQTVEDILREMTAKASKNLPMMVNEDVQATAVVASGKLIMYKYNVTKSREQINISHLRSEYYENSYQAMCSNPGISNLLKHGAEIMYSFYDSNNLFLFDVTISKEGCDSK